MGQGHMTRAPGLCPSLLLDVLLEEVCEDPLSNVVTVHFLAGIFRWRGSQRGRDDSNTAACYSKDHVGPQDTMEQPKAAAERQGPLPAFVDKSIQGQQHHQFPSLQSATGTGANP